MRHPSCSIHHLASEKYSAYEKNSQYNTHPSCSVSQLAMEVGGGIGEGWVEEGVGDGGWG